MVRKNFGNSSLGDNSTKTEESNGDVGSKIYEQKLFLSFL